MMLYNSLKIKLNMKIIIYIKTNKIFPIENYKIIKMHTSSLVYLKWLLQNIYSNITI